MTDQELEKLEEIFNKVGKPTEEEIDGKVVQTVELDPICISMVAPRGAGKTSLLTTMFEYIEHHLNPNKFEIEVREDTKTIINKYAEALQVIKDADSNDDVSAKISSLKATEGVRKFKFSVNSKREVEMKSGKTKTITVKLPFEVMDVAGGVVTGEVSDKVKEFEDHLSKSSVLLIPFDSMLLMQKPMTDDKEALDQYISKRMDIQFIDKWSNKWAKYREGDKHPKAVFVAMKSETYYTHRVTEDKSENCFNVFRDKYKVAIHNLAQSAPQSLEISYTPLETIGCISCVRTEVKQGNDGIELENKFLKKDNIPDYLGMGVIMGVILQRTKEQLTDTYGDAKKWVEVVGNRSLLDKILHPLDTIKEWWNADNVIDFYNGINDITKELDSITKADRCFSEKFNKTI